MLGLGDGQTAAALIACIGITVIGVIYGAVNWNSGDSDEELRRRKRRRAARKRRKAKKHNR